MTTREILIGVVTLIIASVAFGFAMFAKGKSDERARVADSTMTTHLHADSARSKVADAVAAAKDTALAIAVRLADSATKNVRSQVRTVTQIIHDTTKVPAGDTGVIRPVERLANSCAQQAVHDSIVRLRAGESLAACAARVAARDSTISDLTAKIEAGAPSVPRVTFRAGPGYALVWSQATDGTAPVLTGRAAIRGMVDVRVLGPLSLNANADAVFGVPHPVELRAFALWRIK